MSEEGGKVLSSDGCIGKPSEGEGNKTVGNVDLARALRQAADLVEQCDHVSNGSLVQISIPPERLPEDGGDYLCYGPGNAVRITADIECQKSRGDNAKP